MATEPTRRLFTIDDYHRMVDAGILTKDDRVELFEGEIVQMASIGSRHAAAVKRLRRIFGERLGSRAVIGVQDPAILDDFSEPEPDISICAPRDDDYESGHPRPQDILLLIEVADTSLRYDRLRKIPRYATVGIPEAWLVDLERNVIEVHTGPGTSGYEQRTIHDRSSTVSPLLFPDISISVSEVLR